MTVLVLAVAILLSSGAAQAVCRSAECSDTAVVESTRLLVAASCDCEAAKSHKAYVRCAKKVIQGAIDAGNLPATCRKTVRRCEARSTCGRAGAAVCCVPRKTGEIRALVMQNERRCHGTVCTGAMSVADACNDDGTCARRRRGVKAFRSVQTVFKTSCALPSCHSTFARKGGLVLESEEISYASLVDRPSFHPSAAGAGLLRVKSGDPENSFLIRKLRALGPGDTMPQAGRQLPEPVIAMIEAWIARGAHATAEECPRRPGSEIVPLHGSGAATLCDDEGGPVDFIWQPEPPLEVPAPTAGIQLYTPPRDVTPGTEWETCYAFPLDTAALHAQLQLPPGQGPSIKQQTYRMHEGSHHLLLYMYVGGDPDGWAQGYFPCLAANCINAEDCPSDADTALLIPIGGTQVAGTRYEVTYPPGVGIPLLGPRPVLIANLHYTNPFQPPQPIFGEAWLNIYFHGPNEQKVVLDGIFAINSRDLLVEPFESRTISDVWQPENILSGAPEDGAIFQLFGHMHARGTLFQIDYVKDGRCSGSTSDPPDACGRDSDCACKPWQRTCTPGQTCIRGPAAEDTTVYYTTEWDAAPVVDFPPPYFLVNRNEGLRWTCTHVNGIAGDPAHPPKTCHEGCFACGWDPPSRTCHFCKTLERPNLYWNPDQQACFERDTKLAEWVPRVFADGDPMPLVFGLLASDDMCNMFGYLVNQLDLPKIQ